jgi:hypothetical protein
MSASVCNVKLEFVGGPSDGEAHVVRKRRFILGPAEDADVRYEAERLLQGEDRILFEFDKKGELSATCTSGTESGRGHTFTEPLSEGDVLRVGATEILAAEIACGKGDGPSGDAGGGKGGTGDDGDGPIVCGNPACGALNEAGRTWCVKCGRDL